MAQIRDCRYLHIKYSPYWYITCVGVFVGLFWKRKIVSPDISILKVSGARIIWYVFRNTNPIEAVPLLCWTSSLVRILLLLQCWQVPSFDSTVIQPFLVTSATGERIVALFSFTSFTLPAGLVSITPRLSLTHSWWVKADIWCSNTFLGLS